MKLRKWLHRVQWANVGLLAAEFLNNATQAVPSLQMNKYVLITQAVLGALLPSVGGISHKVTGTEVKEVK